MALLWIMGSTVLISLISLVGITALALNEKVLNRALIILVGFSAGALMGGAFLHFLPEAIEKSIGLSTFLSVLIGFSLFFLIERLLRWRHCHDGKCNIHFFTYMSLIGDGVHNFIDGIIVAISYLISVPFGIVTTIALVAHEIPQEIGDFGVLVYGGFTKLKALLFNFLSAATAILGALIGFFLSTSVETLIPFILPFAAGSFIYVAASDLIPELHKEPDNRKSMLSFGFFLIGIFFMWMVKVIFGG